MLLVFVGALFIGGVHFTQTHRVHSKHSTTVEAATGLGNYTVKNGDSLFSVASKFGVSIAALKHVNGLGAEELSPGQNITIPDQPSGDWYTVENGDSLYYIASKYDVSVEALQKFNGLQSALILPQQVLVIPQAKVEVIKTPVITNNPAPKIQQSSLENIDQPLAEVLQMKGLNGSGSQMTIYINKSAHKLSLYKGSARLKSYPVELGDGGLADKKTQGDHRTPEGNFYVAEKSVLRPADPFLGTRWLRLSYPNVEDADRGVRQGLIDAKTHDSIVEAWQNKTIPPQYTALGGGVGIHGGNSKEQGSNWTWGCIGLRNQDIEDFYDFVTVGTPIYIQQ